VRWPLHPLEAHRALLVDFQEAPPQILVGFAESGFFTQPNTHFFSTESTTYFESVTTVIQIWARHGLRPTMMCCNSMRLLVVRRKPG
jgi:hypothetical protein